MVTRRAEALSSQHWQLRLSGQRMRTNHCVLEIVSKSKARRLGPVTPSPLSLCVLGKGPFHSALFPLSAGFIWGHLNPDLSEREETATKQISLPFPPAGKGVCPDKTLDGPSAPHRTMPEASQPLSGLGLNAHIPRPGLYSPHLLHRDWPSQLPNGESSRGWQTETSSQSQLGGLGQV